MDGWMDGSDVNKLINQIEKQVSEMATLALHHHILSILHMFYAHIHNYEIQFFLQCNIKQISLNVYKGTCGRRYCSGCLCKLIITSNRNGYCLN